MCAGLRGASLRGKGEWRKRRGGESGASREVLLGSAVSGAWAGLKSPPPPWRLLIADAVTRRSQKLWASKHMVQGAPDRCKEVALGLTPLQQASAAGAVAGLACPVPSGPAPVALASPGACTSYLMTALTLSPHCSMS